MGETELWGKGKKGRGLHRHITPHEGLYGRGPTVRQPHVDGTAATNAHASLLEEQRHHWQICAGIGGHHTVGSWSISNYQKYGNTPFSECGVSSA